MVTESGGIVWLGSSLLVRFDVDIRYDYPIMVVRSGRLSIDAEQLSGMRMEERHESLQMAALKHDKDWGWGIKQRTDFFSRNDL